MRIAAATKPIQPRVLIWSVPGEWGAKARQSYTRALMRSPLRSSPALRVALRATAAGALASAVAVPLLRRRTRTPAPVTVAACAAGPLSLAVLRPRTPARDVALFAMQMWAFTMVHELPYDNPERLRARLRARYPIAVDRVIGLGRLPNARLQQALAGRRGVGRLNKFLTWVHWLWFLEPYCALVYILIRHPEQFPRAARRLAAVFDVGCVAYFAVPTAPPWWSSQEGLTEEPVRRIMEEVGKDFWGGAWERMYGALGGNPWAAMPSLHFATSLSAAGSLAEAGRGPGAVGWAYALTLGFALVYLGEHYVTDLAAGAALVGGVRAVEPLAEPLVLGVNRRLQGLETIANG
jgi:membrane-associated phospholipid phosphatase